MPTTRTLIKSGEGNATAALVAGTTSNVAVVTLPSDPGYEYKVTIAASLKMATTTCYATLRFGNVAQVISLSGTVAGQIRPFPCADVILTEIGYPTTSSNGMQSTVGGLEAYHTATYGPGVAVTASITSSSADTYDLHYTYIGRKTIVESF